MSELRRYEATLVHKCGENPYMVMASADDGDYCEYQQAADEITRLRQLLSEAEKREAEARGKALEEAAKIADQYVWDDHALAQATSLGRAVHCQSVEIAAAIRALQSEER